MLRAWAIVAVACCVAPFARGASLSNSEITELCAQAEDPAQCGRLVEGAQLKRLPNLARRDGNVLSVTLYPAGTASFTDDEVSGRSYSLWDYLDGLNAVLLYTTVGETTTFTLLQRTTNRRIELPTEPQLAPDRQHLVTADICAERCSNEVAVWRVSRDGIRKELAWSPGPAWTDASAKWKDGATLSFDYVGPGGPGTAEKKLNDPAWKRVP
ncbi:MAG TPA: hypothetical protein VMN79_19200 [Casimicrobiaceae bacterium]|nr:hypothetical protein [Casimicrobiaceae bacterium]